MGLVSGQLISRTAQALQACVTKTPPRLPNENLKSTSGREAHTHSKERRPLPGTHSKPADELTFAAF
jgi:hypothetical protein